MKKLIVAAAVLAGGFVAVRFGPSLAQRAMDKCHEMMAQMPRGSQPACASHEERLKATTV